jgi:hypothetical protein
MLRMPPGGSGAGAVTTLLTALARGIAGFAELVR